MPYPNEHAFRIKDPKQYKRIRRQNNKFGAGIHVLWGIPENGKPEAQAIRFDAGKFSFAQAKKWIKDHNYAPTVSEKATGEQTEARWTVAPGLPLTELAKLPATGVPLLEAVTKGSLEYAEQELRSAFRAQFVTPLEQAAAGAVYNPEGLYIDECFADHVIVNARGLPPDEYYLVPYTVGAAGNPGIAFARREDWEIVELAYRAQTEDVPAEDLANATDAVQVVESQQAGAQAGNGKDKRFVERVSGSLQLVESEQDNEGGPWRLKGIGVTADVVNLNGRRYAAPVLRDAVQDLQQHLNESAGQGRALLLGEADHPQDKGAKRPLLAETVVNWKQATFDGEHVLLEGLLLGTSLGKDIHAQMKGGVIPEISQRSRGDSRRVKVGDQMVEDVTWCTITGYDLVVAGQGSDPDAGVTFHESQQEKPKMDPEELKKLIGAHPELFKDLIEGKLEELGAEQLKKLEETVRTKLGLKPEDDLGKALTEAVEAKKELEEGKRRATIVVEITKETKDLPYPANVTKAFIEAVQGHAFQTADEVKPFVEAKRKEYDALVADMKLKGMGWGVQVTGPVLEQETGYKEFARGAYEFTEALVRRGQGKHVDVRKPANRNEAFTAMLMERFDQAYARVQNGGGLIAESRLLQEAETAASDLNLPYSASRAIIAAATAQLIASSVFDFGVVETSPTRVYYELYAADTTIDTVVAVGADALVADYGVWVDLDHKRIKPGTLVAKNHAEGETYVEGTDYVVDYMNGKFMALSGATIAEADTHIGYTYMAIRKGEMGVIERGKGQLAYVTLDCQADRLAQQVSQEAIVFSRSQIGWDAVTRTMSMIIEQIRRKIDKDAFYMGLANALSVASNVAGTWDSSADPIDDFVSYIGTAKVKVANRYYVPQSIALSTTRSNDISNWTGFTAAGKFPTADLKENGYVGRLKGLPVFETTEFSDSYALVVNPELVAHRVFLPMVIKGPFPSYDQATAQLVAADQYYAEEFNGEVCPIPGKGSVVKIT